jgi:plastocyanin
MRWKVIPALGILIIAAALEAEEWQGTVGGQSPGGDIQALAFLPNEFWIHVGDSIRWIFSGDEIHTVTFLKNGQVRPPNYSSTFGMEVGCGSPVATADGASYDGNNCVNSGNIPWRPNPEVGPRTYSVQFPATGNFKFVCLIHVDQTGVVHVMNLSETLPHDQDFYDREAEQQQRVLRSAVTRLAAIETRGDGNKVRTNHVVAGTGAIVTTTGGGSQVASLMRFLQDTTVVRVGDTVEWTNLDPSIPHVVTFGKEPDDPRLPFNVLATLPPGMDDGARRAVIHSPDDRVSSGTLPPAQQDRVNSAQTVPGTTRFRVTFMVPGTFHYTCAIHDELGMKGTVIVQ